MLQSAFFGFTDNKEILKSLAICILNLSIIYLNSNTKKNKSRRIEKKNFDVTNFRGN